MRGGGGDAGDGGSRGPFDRLRANGRGKRPYDGEWGMRWRMETPRASPLWIPSFAGMTRAEGPLRVPSGQASTGSGRTDAGSAPTTGSGGAEAPRASPLWIPAFAGMTRAEGPLRVPSGQASTSSGRTDLGSARAVGSGGCDGGWRRPSPRPSGCSCLRRNDACGRPPSSALRTGFDRLRTNGFGKRAYGGEWGCDGGRRHPAPRPSGFLPSPVRRWGWGGWRVLLVSGGGPALAGRAIRESPLRRGVGVGSAKGVGDGGAPPAPLWIPAFAGMTRAEGPLRVPSGQASTGSGRTDAGSARAVGSGGAMGDGDAPRLAPLDSCLRRNDACGRPPSSALRTGFDKLRANGFGKRACGGEWGVRWGTETPRAAPLWIPAFAGMTRAEGPSTGSGRTDLGGAPSVGSGGAMGDEDAPRRAPLDTGFRRYDGGGGGAGECCWCRAGVPLSRDGRFANRPYGVGWESGAQRGLVMGVPRPCPSGFLPSQE